MSAGRKSGGFPIFNAKANRQVEFWNYKAMQLFECWLIRDSPTLSRRFYKASFVCFLNLLLKRLISFDCVQNALVPMSLTSNDPYKSNQACSEMMHLALHRDAVPPIHAAAIIVQRIFTKLFLNLTCPSDHWWEVSHPPPTWTPALRRHAWRSHVSGHRFSCRGRRTAPGDRHSVWRAVLLWLCDRVQLHSKNSDKSSNHCYLLRILFRFFSVWSK